MPKLFPKRGFLPLFESVIAYMYRIRIFDIAIELKNETRVSLKFIYIPIGFVKPGKTKATNQLICVLNKHIKVGVEVSTKIGLSYEIMCGTYPGFVTQ